MSLFNTMQTGASGMGVASVGLSMIGDNIANLNTNGFKGSRAVYADVFPTATGPDVVGLGARVLGTTMNFEQGTVSASSSALDVAISGRGFFAVKNGDETMYTRDGSFGVDADYNLVTPSGMQVQGYPAVNGNITSSVDNLQISAEAINQRMTSFMTLEANLSAGADYASTPYAALGYPDGSTAGPSIEDLSTEADFSTSISVYDSLGVAHDVTVFFERTGASDWRYSAVIDAGEVDRDGDGTIDGEPGYGLEISEGTLSFDTEGNLENFTQSTPSLMPVWSWPGADNWNFEFQAGLDNLGNPIGGKISLGGSESAVTAISQNGYPSGGLASVQVDYEGVISALYTNGEEGVIGQLAIAIFPADSGLQRMGQNVYRSTRDSGAAAMGAATSGGRGGIISFALERSNVELEDEFVSMIQSQRSYQAASGVIRTADETLQELVNLV